MNRFILASFLAAFPHSRAGGQQPKYPEVGGCYKLTVSEWNRPLKGDKGFHDIPPWIELDTSHAERGGRVVKPDISFPAGHSMRGTPRWNIVGNTVRVVWSNGFTPTSLFLVRSGTQFRGWAEARSDAVPPGKTNWPRAQVVAQRVDCKQVLVRQ